MDSILKTMFQWMYGLFLDLISYSANALLSLMNTDLTYFEQNVPIVMTLYGVMTAVGWGLLIGNLAFQAMKSMLSGMGFEGEEPASLLLRTGVFSFLLIFSRQICEIGLGIGKSVIELVGIPEHIELTTPDESGFDFGASWVLVIIIGVVLGFQLVKLFFEIGERYVIICVLNLFAPLAMSMGGSKATKDICTGFIRTFASMILMLVMNVVFLKLILSSLSVMPSGLMVLPWCVLVVALARVARKIDNIISKIGLNPAITGDPLGHGGGIVAMTAARTVVSSATKLAGKGAKAAARGIGKGIGSAARAAENAKSMQGPTFGGSHTQVGGASMGDTFGSSYQNNSTGSFGSSQINQDARSNQESRLGAPNSQSSLNSNYGTSSFGSVNNAGGNASAMQSNSSNVRFGSGAHVNYNRFGMVTDRPNAGGSSTKGGAVSSFGRSAGNGAVAHPKPASSTPVTQTGKAAQNIPTKKNVSTAKTNNTMPKHAQGQNAVSGQNAITPASGLQQNKSPKAAKGTAPETNKKPVTPASGTPSNSAVKPLGNPPAPIQKNVNPFGPSKAPPSIKPVSSPETKSDSPAAQPKEPDTPVKAQEETDG